MHTQNLIIIGDVNRVTFQPDLFSVNDRNIGIFGESGTSNTILLKNIIIQAKHLGLPVFGINLTKILDSRFYKWETETVIESKVYKVIKGLWGIDDNSDKGSLWISRLVAESSQFDKSIFFINDCTAFLKNSEASQYLGKLCGQSNAYGIQIILAAESSHDCSQKIIKNLGNRFIVLPQFNPLN